MVDTYQVTSISCLRDDSGRTNTVLDRYHTSEIQPGTSPDRARLHIGGAVGDRTLRRLAGLPASCTNKVQPPAFDVFWQTFQENYPFFAAKGIDWNEVRDRIRERAVTAENRGDAAGLFAALRDMVTPLNDEHVSVSAGDTGFFGIGRPGTVVPSPEIDAKVKSAVQRRDLRGRTFTEYARGRISYADLPDRPEYGYLRVSGFSGFTKEDTFAANSAELARALTDIFTPDRRARLRGLILDLRVNGGGSDQLGFQLAAQLTDRPYFAYAKKTRTTDPQPLQIQPAATGSAIAVAILTGGSTVSAGETFTQAMIERPAPTVRIGQPTQGVFSDVMQRKLPGARHNTWRFGLPNERYLTSDGHTFDGPGIPPQIPEPVFTDEEFALDRDSAFDRAAQWLDQ